MRKNPFDLDNDNAYQAWRDKKLGDAPATLEDLVVEIKDPRALSAAEHQGLMDRCRKANMAGCSSDWNTWTTIEVPKRMRSPP